MVHLLRKYQQSLLIAITILVIITFIWFWNGSQAGRAGLAGNNKVATIYGQSISDTDLQRVVRQFQLAYALGLNELIRALAGNAENQQQALENFVWNSYVFEHEADVLQVFPTDSEVQDELGRVPGFQTDGRFDPNKLTDFVQSRLPSLGFNDSVIDDLLRDQVRVRKIMALVGSTVDLSPAELKNRFAEENEKMDVSVVRLNASDIEKTITVPDDVARKAYDAHKELLHSDEQRKVSIAGFELSDAQKALKGKERTDALQKLGDAAWAFAQAVVDKGSDFSGVAKKQGAQLSESAFFTASQPDPALAKIPALATTAFRLSADYPSSDVVESPNGYYVLHLDETRPSRQLSFEEAKDGVVAQLKKDQASQLMQTKANEVRNRILADVKAGKSFADAALDAGASAESIPPFSLSDASKMDVPDAQAIIQNAVSLPDGGLSEFVSTDAGGLLVYMSGREPVDKNAFIMEEALVKEQFLRQQQMGAFLEWMRLRKEAARLQIVQR